MQKHVTYERKQSKFNAEWPAIFEIGNRANAHKPQPAPCGHAAAYFISLRHF